MWGPFGQRQAKLMKFNAQMFVDSVLTTRLLHWPTSFDAWRACWRVFRTNMQMLKASLQGPLAEHEEKVRWMDKTFPDCWGIIMMAEDQLRSEQWERKRAQIEGAIEADRYREQFDPSMPWLAVVRDCARDEPWWNKNVIVECQKLTKSRSVARSQRPPPQIAFRPDSPWGKGPKKTQKIMAEKAQRSDGRYLKNGMKQLCFAYNRSENGCARVCKENRTHLCEWCLEEHRAIDNACKAPKRPRNWAPKPFQA